MRAFQQLQTVAPASTGCSGKDELTSAVSTRRHSMVAQRSSMPAAARANAVSSSEPIEFSPRAFQQLQTVAPASTGCGGKDESASAVSTHRHSMVAHGSSMSAAARANATLSHRERRLAAFVSCCRLLSVGCRLHAACSAEIDGDAQDAPRRARMRGVEHARAERSAGVEGARMSPPPSSLSLRLIGVERSVARSCSTLYSSTLPCVL